MIDPESALGTINLSHAAHTRLQKSQVDYISTKTTLSLPYPQGILPLSTR